jgi:retinol-binding protein 3
MQKDVWQVSRYDKDTTFMPTRPFFSHAIPARFRILTCITLCLVCICLAFAICGQTKGTIDKSYRSRTIDTISNLIAANYVFPEKAKGYASQLQFRKQAGAYDSLADLSRFAKRLTDDLQTITGDKHILVRPILPSDLGESTESALHHPVRLFRLQNRENTGFFRLEWLDGDIGYMDLRRFYSPAVAREMLAAAMKFLSHANAIIIDVRENQGGSGELLSLFCGYFFPYPLQLNGEYYRSEDYLEEFWVARTVEGERLTRVPLFVLTSRKTFSAAESFAYDMKVRKRAILVGDSTKGGAHSVDLFRVDDRLECYLSTSRAVNPVTGGNWEGTGVVPDIHVPAASALDTALVLARRAAEEYGRTKEVKLKRAVDEMQVHMQRAETLFREGNHPPAEAALDSLFRIGSNAGLINEFFVDVLAYNYSSAKDEPILYAILRKKIEHFPRSSTAYESLGVAYFRNGKGAEAIPYLRKAFELDPDNRNASRMISRLQEK